MRREKKGRVSLEDKLLRQSQIFSSFGRLFRTTEGKSMLQADRDEILAKVCTGLSKVCKMLARRIKEESTHASKT